jgi:hypothetical protein
MHERRQTMPDFLQLACGKSSKCEGDLWHQAAAKYCPNDATVLLRHTRQLIGIRLIGSK